MVAKRKVIAIAKSLRNKATDAERKLWQRLKLKQIEGRKFRRQSPIGKYIADFVCFERKIVIEVDGGQHGFEHGKSADYERSEWLQKEGFRVLRFWNNEVIENIEGVLESIRLALEESPPSPTHPSGGYPAPPIKGGEVF